MSERMAYCGRKPCGCLVAACLDGAAYADGNAKEIARWVRDGWTVERMTVDEAREQLHFCHHKAAPTDQLALEVPS